MNSIAEKIKNTLESRDFLGLPEDIKHLLGLTEEEFVHLVSFYTIWENRLTRLYQLFTIEIGEDDIARNQCLKQLSLDGIELSAHWMQLNDEINYKTVFQLGEDQLSIAKAYLCSKIIELIQPLLQEHYINEQADSIKRHLISTNHHP